MASSGFSDTSAPGHERPGTSRGGREEEEEEEFEEYRDEPANEDARVYEGRSVQAPPLFGGVGEMTAEELEEERRIDLAIAEAERR